MESSEKTSRSIEELIAKAIGTEPKEVRSPIPFYEFIELVAKEPKFYLRDVFQLFYDMVFYYVNKTPSYRINTNLPQLSQQYDLNNLLVKDCDNPFFADRIFADRFIDLVNSLKRRTSQNHLILFEGPPGSGKSTFLNNLAQKVEEYAQLPEGALYKTYWRINVETFRAEGSPYSVFNGEERDQLQEHLKIPNEELKTRKSIDFSCPRHDHPILQIPKSIRQTILDELIPDKKFKEKLFNDAEYEWVLRDVPCNICQSLYSVMLNRLKDPNKIFNMIFARKAVFKRLFGVGISVFNPSDPIAEEPFTNEFIEDALRYILRTDNIDFTYSDLSFTNNGIYALMDIKENNRERLFRLHGIISDGIHKVGLVEERIKSLFLGLVNPEDKIHFEGVKSFQDRIIYVRIPYVLDYKTEVEIYRDKFGDRIENRFLPGVIQNFAKIIIASRVNKNSPAIKQWIPQPGKYQKFLDQNLLLLKICLYAGDLPEWLDEDDLKKLDSRLLAQILQESSDEGYQGISGRHSIQLLGEFLEQLPDDGKQITMNQIVNFFNQYDFKGAKEIPDDFIPILSNNYDYKVVQEVKESLYDFNQEEIENRISNYLYAISFDIGETVKSPYTNDEIEVSEDYFKSFEVVMLGANSSTVERKKFRREMSQTYVNTTLAQEIQVENRALKDTTQFKKLYSRYVKYLKESAIEPYSGNQNFRRALLDFKTPAFANYDDRTKRDIRFLINNLKSKFGYSTDGAIEIANYVLENRLENKFSGL
jgi:predicted Ser/Thr protein kinase